MVTGNGMIAKAFESYLHQQDFVIFASGVSNSVNASDEAFARELKLVSDTIKKSNGKLFVYFSTCSITDLAMQSTAYVQHKIKVEDFIISNYSPYIIFRLTNPVGNTKNTNTVVNYLVKHIIKNEKFSIWKNASRNIIDMDDVYTICNEILQKKLFTDAILNIASPVNYPVPFIIKTIEKHVGIPGNYTLVDKAGEPEIEIGLIEPLFTKFNINFDENYLPQLLQKYFPCK